MAQQQISVTLTVGSGTYQKTLPRALAMAGMLRRVLSLGPYLDIQELGKMAASRP